MLGLPVYILFVLPVPSTRQFSPCFTSHHTSIIAVHALQVFIFCGVGKEPLVNSNTKCKIVVHYSPFYLSLLKYENFLPLCKIDNILIYYECLFVRKLLMYSNPQNTDFFSEINIFVLSLVSRQSLPL